MNTNLTRWISMKIAKPKNPGEYLVVCCFKNDIRKVQRKILQYITAGDLGCFVDQDALIVTHWQMLDEIPTKENTI